jgi:excisionase family DNA binding protein
MQHESTASAPLANSIPQACQRLSIGRTAMYELLKTGEVRAIKVGNRTLIPESELQRFIAERMKEAA